MNLTRTNKTKFIARVMALILLLTSALNFSGCVSAWGRHAYFKGMETDGVHLRPADIVVMSNTNIYNIDDLTLDLLIGLHRTSFFGIIDDEPKKQYAYLSRNIGFAIYISEGEYEDDFPSSVDDITNIDNHLFVDEITEEEAFTKEYAYGRFGYNHQRKIKIPSEYLSEETGKFIIKLANYYIFEEYGDQHEYVTPKYDFFIDYSIYVIVLEYEKTEDGKVMITNFDE